VSVQMQLSGPPTQRESSRVIRLPSQTTGFDCLLINVMGSGIPNRNPKDEQADMASILAGSFCSYPGVLSKFINVPRTAAETVSLSLPVPVGTRRVVQVLGVIYPGGCQGNIEDLLDSVSNDSEGKIKGIFEIGRAIVDTVGNVSVTIPNNYNSASPREVTCEGRNRMVDCTKHLSDSPFAAGSGTEKDPYAICTATQLANVNTARSAHYFVGEDITLSGEWVPLGSTATAPFSGTFDGRGFQISGLSIAANGAERGLFGRNDGAIKNVNVTGSISVSSISTKVGILAGANYGTITHSRSTGSASGSSSVSLVGGLVGYSSGGTISRSSSSAAANGGTYVGGLVGGAYADTSPATTIERCYADGAVSGSSNNIGGFAGALQAATVKDSYAQLTASITGADSVGGFVGLAQMSSNILRSHVYGTASSVPPAATNNNCFTGNLASVGDYSNVYAQSDLASSPTGGDSATLLSAASMKDSANFLSTFMGFDFDKIWFPPNGTTPPTLR
jgi:hypothetical protein